ncbi:cytochrome c oxidase assembly factor 1 family protein [Xanthomonas sp. NCPPB 2654]|uniref:cytochrome c oxidase assembly factor 1 family protein n=1 Tax=unclassified Xanthomonas TaxID=2643310 RepID=UPI0021DF9658|nr:MULTISPECIES: cytochrome c oxidase assembly factor 1 family protein [unclassified Xanthomonas]MDL5364291.1 cytochrome c oxidase assembly factor 1 family protein [Xanthomonas sp. NCPPB 2654]UYC20414.1 cytochrome c oxidase assembly factor 1 family protein [Xanthomonas sp. CFBP 8443]
MSTPPPLPETSSAPPPPPSQPQPQPQQLPAKRGWWARHWKWAVPLLALLLGAMLLGSIAMFVAGIASVTKSSEPYQVGLKAAQHDPRVIEALGAPVEDGIMPSGSISTSNGTGSANFSVSLHGARGNGTLYIEAERHAGEWHYTTLQVLPDAGEAIPLLDESDMDEPGETGVESDPEMDAADETQAEADPVVPAEADSTQ